MKFWSCLIGLIGWGCWQPLQAQNSQLRSIKLAVSDSLQQIDSLPIVPGSVQVLQAGNWATLPDTCIVNFKYLKCTFGATDSVWLRYRVFGFDWDKRMFHKDESAVTDIRFARENPFNVLPPTNPTDQWLDFRQLDKQGSISRGLGLGNNQDLVLNAGFNLQLSGKLTDSIELLASMTDNNLPFQPDGYTQQLQDFDRVFIQLKTSKNRLIVGDFDLNRPNSYFLNYFKNVKGLSIENQGQLGAKGYIRQRASLSAARGQFGRNVFLGREGNQGPYRLTGDAAGQFIVVLAGSERVYIDGELLKRGEQYDYVIDYNTADLIFTPNRIITNQSRIIVEFEYANQAYLRTIASYSAQYEQKNWDLSFHTYREGDSPNQPLFQELNAEQRLFLRDAGEPTGPLFFPAATFTNFDGRQVRYKRIDSLGFSPVYVYSINPDSARYAVSFSLVGQGKGDYVPAVSTANGRVFQWVAPQVVNGDTIKRGTHAAVVQLIPPSKLQMSTLGFSWRPDAFTKVRLEGARSENSSNLLAAEGRAPGHALKAAVQTNRPLGKSTDWRLLLGGDVEWLSNTFRIVQPYRNMEYARDWNLANLYAETAEGIGQVEAGLSYKDSTRVLYRGTRYLIANGYDAQRHRFEGQWVDTKQRFFANYDLLDTRSAQFEGAFRRYRAGYVRKVKRLEWGGSYEQENNLVYRPGTDTLALNSFRFDIAQMYVQYTGQYLDKISLRYVFRDDQLPFLTDRLTGTQSGHNYSIGAELNRFEDHQLKLTATVRRLLLFDTPVQTGSSSLNLLGQLDYTGQFWQKLLSATSFYSFSQGQELRRELAYLEVPRGQGTFVWVDYNGNGVQELDEFEQAVFADQANYIRVFIPGNTFIPVYNTRFSQQFQWQPEYLLGNQHWLSKFSNLTVFSLDRREQGTTGLAYLNPIRWQVADTNLVSATGNFRSSLFFNRNNPRFGVDLTYSQQLNRLLLANGTESRSNTDQGLRIRYNPTAMVGLESQLTIGERNAEADLFAVRNFAIQQWEWLPVVNWTVNQQWRLSGRFALRNKQNTLATELNGGNLERANIREAGAEVNFNALGASSIRTTFSLVWNDFTGNANSPAGFEMLQGLFPGRNQLWSVGLFRKLTNNLQLNLTYEGRASETARTVHTGRVQARLNF